ncbi:MAG: hypothetical protein FJ272_13385 [Planctomycetes bacterium]|nr:hypothetical protein [Planctomycetota bacterium]
MTLAYPVKFAQTPIQVDGKLTPQEWDAAVRVSGFRLSGSEALAPEQTVMQLLYDQQNLYLGVKCAESQMDKLVVKCLMDDGDVWHDDCIEFFMDATHDHATYWQFIVNPAATRYDAAGFDRTWNCNWKAAASKEANAWFIEVAIPFKELKTPTPTPGAVWGFNLARERRAGIGGKLQLYNWADVQGNFHRPTLYGHLWFVGRDWQPSEQDTATAAKRAGGKEARIYVPGGCWIVQEGQKPKAWTYRDLLATQEGVVTKYLDDLSDIYKRHPRAALRSDFDALTKRYQEVKQLAAGPGPADPEACAAAKVFLDGLEGKASDLYWRVRIELLNETF